MALLVTLERFFLDVESLSVWNFFYSVEEVFVLREGPSGVPLVAYFSSVLCEGPSGVPSVEPAPHSLLYT